jgi:hypothetical protein
MWIHPSYRLGNVIEAWYGQHHVQKRDQESVSSMTRNFPGTFGKFLDTCVPSNLVQNPTPKFLDEAEHSFWWGLMENQKSVHPWFGQSIRSAIREFFQNDVCTHTSNTCVIHVRVGDMLAANSSEFKVQYILDATDKLPRIPDCFEILNGGKFHDHLGLIGRSETLLTELANGIHKKFPDATVTKIESHNADLDFYRMIKAPMLITGVGSFAILAAVANENFRLTPALSQMGFYNRKYLIKPENVYDGWHTYSVA